MSESSCKLDSPSWQRQLEGLSIIYFNLIREKKKNESSGISLSSTSSAVESLNTISNRSKGPPTSIKQRQQVPSMSKKIGLTESIVSQKSSKDFDTKGWIENYCKDTIVAIYIVHLL